MSTRILLSLLEVLLLILHFSCSVSAKRPNIVFILTDDQDLVLGGMVSMFLDWDLCEIRS